MNREILGGWKYINDHTGEFFTDASDVVSAYQKMQARADQLTPREWYR